MAAFRKRLTGSSKNFHIINLTLTLIETTVKNCGLRLHTKIAQKDFLKDLMSVINAKVFKLSGLVVFFLLCFFFSYYRTIPPLLFGSGYWD